MKRPILNRLWASGGLVSAIPDAKYGLGFIQEKPDHGQQNFLQVQEEDFTLSNMEDGVPYWRLAVSYVKGALVKFNDKVYVAVAPSKGTSPPNVAYWKESLGLKSYPDVSRLLLGIFDIKDVHARDVRNPHKVTASQVGTYTKAEVDVKDILVPDLDSHIKLVNNPHKVSYTQLGILPISGGQFEWVHTNASEFSLNGSLKLKSDGESVALSTQPNSDIGIGDGYPYTEDSTGIQQILHEGNYLEVRNKFEPRYKLPFNDVQFPLSSNLDTRVSYACLTANWDNLVFDSSKGLKLDGTVSFDAEEGLGQELTISSFLTGAVTLTVGDVVIHHSPTSVTVNDGVNSLTAQGGNGYFTYVRSKSKGVLYKGGKVVASKEYATGTTSTTASISGGGYIKGLRLWATDLSPEQVTLVR